MTLLPLVYKLTRSLGARVWLDLMSRLHQICITAMYRRNIQLHDMLCVRRRSQGACTWLSELVFGLGILFGKSNYNRRDVK